MLANTSEYERLRANSSERVRVRASAGEDAQIRANLIEYWEDERVLGNTSEVSECVSRAGDAVDTGVKSSTAGRSRVGETVHVLLSGLASAIGSTRSREVARMVKY
jgi:hypothetical protein